MTSLAHVINFSVFIKRFYLNWKEAKLLSIRGGGSLSNYSKNSFEKFTIVLEVKKNNDCPTNYLSSLEVIRFFLVFVSHLTSGYLSNDSNFRLRKKKKLFKHLRGLFQIIPTNLFCEIYNGNIFQEKSKCIPWFVYPSWDFIYPSLYYAIPVENYKWYRSVCVPGIF